MKSAVTYCMCGNEAGENQVQCASCAALQCLELKMGATRHEIHEAFETLSKVWQPDHFEFDPKMKALAAEKRKALSAAYDYLSTHAALPGAFRAQPAPPQRQQQTAAVDLVAFDSNPSPGEAETVRVKSKSDKRLILPPAGIIVGAGMVLAGVVTLWLIYKPMDAALLSNPATAVWYREYKGTVQSKLQQMKGALGFESGSLTKPSAAPETAAVPDGQQTPAVRVPAGKALKHQDANANAQVAVDAHTQPERVETVHLAPLITTGMTKSEVIAAQGEPTASAPDRLVYGKSELYFRDGSLEGWKIDPAAPIRVKIWPSATVDPDLAGFGAGSTRNEVIAVQGTPTFLSEDTFGYGASEVHFINNRVVGWKNDPSSPLRLVAR